MNTYIKKGQNNFLESFYTILTHIGVAKKYSLAITPIGHMLM